MQVVDNCSLVNVVLDPKLSAVGAGRGSGHPSQAAGPRTPRPAKGLPAQATAAQSSELSAAQAITYMMQNMLDDFSVMHAGIQDEVRAAFGSQRMPSAAQDGENTAGSKAERSRSSASSSSTPRATRQTSRSTREGRRLPACTRDESPTQPAQVCPPCGRGRI